MKRKVGKILAAAMSLALLFQVNVFAQESDNVRGKVNVTIEPSKTLSGLKAGDEFTLTIKMKNTLSELIQGTHHLTLREHVSVGGTAQAVKLCTIPSAGNEAVRADGHDIVDTDTLQSIVLKNLGANEEISVIVNCTVPQNLEGQDISIDAVLSIDDGYHTILGSASTTASVAPAETPDPVASVEIKSIVFPDADPNSLKKDQEFKVKATVRNSGNTSLPYVYLSTLVSNEYTSDLSTAVDFGQLIPQDGILMDQGIPYVKDMQPGASITFTFKGKLPAGITAKNPWLAAGAAATDGPDAETSLAEDIKWFKLTVGEEAAKPQPPVDNGDKEDGGQGLDTKKPVPESKAQSASVKKAAKTGDESNITFILALMLISGAGLVYGSKRIKQY